jgi:acyl-CoA thioesterase FadM/ketosteroid isomerase-like protein
VRPEANVELVGELLRRQGAMYRGGGTAPVGELLADGITWHVPGRSPIAGDHRGRDGVLAYFARRRALADASMRMETVATAAHDTAVVHLTDGRARLAGTDAAWRTAGVYRIADDRIAEVWLVPLDLAQFDALWSRPRRVAHRHEARVRAQECNAHGVLGHPRFLEHFEAAFIEAWRRALGPLDAVLGPARRLTVSRADTENLGAVRFDDLLAIAVAFDRVGRTSIAVHYDASVNDTRVAEARVRYVCLDAASGKPVPLPEEVAPALLA